MKNVFWLQTNRLAGRAGPEYAPWNLTELREAGFGAVLNVAEVAPAWSEFDVVGIDIVWVPLPNHYPATPETEAACLRGLPQAYRFVRRHWARQKAVLVHCAWGRDRTGLVLAYHLAYEAKITPSEAICQIRQVQPKALTASGWAEMAVRVISQLLSGPAKTMPIKGNKIL